MISRTWHGLVPITNGKVFEEYEYQTGIKDTKALPGYCGAFLRKKQRRNGEYSMKSESP